MRKQVYNLVKSANQSLQNEVCPLCRFSVSIVLEEIHTEISSPGGAPASFGALLQNLQCYCEFRHWGELCHCGDRGFPLQVAHSLFWVETVELATALNLKRFALLSLVQFYMNLLLPLDQTAGVTPTRMRCVKFEMGRVRGKTKTTDNETKFSLRVKSFCIVEVRQPPP